MHFLKFIIIDNFKSYRGVHNIGPLKPFTIVVAPNETGKSDFMDAVSFVMGEQAPQLRVECLHDLIYKPSVDAPAAISASVTATFIDENKIEKQFERIILNNYTEYRIDAEMVSEFKYLTQLAALGIYVNPKNFLVSQGTVENIAKMNPKELTALFEEISGSGALKEKYDACMAEVNRVKEAQLALKEKEVAAKAMEVMREEAEAEDTLPYYTVLADSTLVPEESDDHHDVELQKVKKERYRRFVNFLQFASHRVADIYKGLSMSDLALAAIEPENAEAPYLAGIHFECVPPSNVGEPMADLTAQQKIVAALAMIFVIRSFRPAPFLILEDINALLDHTHLAKVTAYIKSKSYDSPAIIITQQEKLYSSADRVISIRREPLNPQRDDSKVYKKIFNL